MIACAKYQVITCQLSGIRYQVSGTRCQVMPCKVSVSYIKYQVINMVSGKLNTKSQHHMSGNDSVM